MTEVPKGWVEVPLGELGESIKGSMQPRGAGSYDLYSVPSFATGEPEVLSGSEIGSHKRPVLPSDLLICKINPRINRVWAVGPRRENQQIASPEWLVVRPGQPVLTNFLRYQFTAPNFRRWIERGVHGVTGSHTRAKDDHVLAYVTRVAPTAEQERIVTAIEEAFAKLDAGEAGLRTARHRLRRLREAVLAAAATGRLVPQDPTDTPVAKLLADLGVVNAIGNGLPEGWARVRLGDVSSVGSGTTPKRGDARYWQGGTIPWVTSGLVATGIIREAREFVTSRALSDTSLRLWSPGTLLVAMYGEGQTRGRCAELGLEATCNQACAAISLQEPLGGYKGFVRLCFDANYSANRRLASGGVQPNLNAGLIKDMVLALPPARECQAIVTEVERQFSFIEVAERAVDIGLARSAALRRSVLKAAFEGRLVPQDPSDEPALALLERIRDERSAAPPTRRRSRASA